MLKAKYTKDLLSRTLVVNEPLEEYKRIA